MNKKKAAAYVYDHATPQLFKRVAAVLSEAENHKYSVSRVYAAYNEAFQKRDQPQTCSSCLRNRVRELRAWLGEYNKTQSAAAATSEGPDTTQVDTPYERLVKRLGLASWDGDAAAELATLGTVIGDDYGAHLSAIGQPLLTKAEVDAVLTRMAELEALVKEDDVPQNDVDDVPQGYQAYEAPAVGTVRFYMNGGIAPIDFKEDTEGAEVVFIDVYGEEFSVKNKGTVLHADGSKVKAGTYDTVYGYEIAVQPGGKATIKTKEEDLT